MHVVAWGVSASSYTHSYPVDNPEKPLSSGDTSIVHAARPRHVRHHGHRTLLPGPGGHHSTALFDARRARPQRAAPLDAVTRPSVGWAGCAHSTHEEEVEADVPAESSPAGRTHRFRERMAPKAAERC
jgi:hypothetical protein